MVARASGEGAQLTVLDGAVAGRLGRNAAFVVESDCPYGFRVAAD